MVRPIHELRLRRVAEEQVIRGKIFVQILRPEARVRVVGRPHIVGAGADVVAVEQGIIVDLVAGGGRIDADTRITGAVPTNIMVYDEVARPVIQID